MKSSLGIVLSAVLVFNGCASSGLTKGFQVAVGATAVADVVTTNHALSVGAREWSLLGRGSDAQRWASKAAVAGVVMWAGKTLEDKGRPVLARVALGVVAGVWLVASVNNVIVAR